MFCVQEMARCESPNLLWVPGITGHLKSFGGPCVDLGVTTLCSRDPEGLGALPAA